MNTSEEFFNAINSSDYILRDGVGMELLLKGLSVPPGRNMNGTDFIPKVLSLVNDQTVALYGTSDPWLEIAVKKLKTEGIEIVDYANGFLTFEDYLFRISKFRPNVIILGMGMPKQEILAKRVSIEIPENNCLIICGGAIIDFISGKVQRAPLIIRKMRLEWLFRLAQEPVRLFNRYIVGNILFLVRTIRLVSKIKKS